MSSKRRKIDNSSKAQSRRAPVAEIVVNPYVYLHHSACKHPIASLPFELVASSILCDHFTLEEMARFDQAITNRSLRSYFMQVYTHAVLTRHTILKFDDALRWMCVRGIRGRHFELWHGIGKVTLTSFFRAQSARDGGALFETLNLTGYDYLTDAMVGRLAQGAPNLKNLNLAYCSDITDAGVAALASHCHNLRSLVLWGCYELTNESIAVLTHNCPKISTLNLRCCRKITDEGLAGIVAGFRTMYSLNFTYCRNITDIGVGYLAAAYPMLRRISFAYCVDVTDAAVRSLAQHCFFIECLDLTNCNISNEALLYIAYSPMARNLKELFISTCRNVTDAGITQLGEKCKQLTAFHVAGCDQITLAGLRALPPTCIVHNPS